MTDINLQTITPDTTLPTTGFLFGADSQASGSPSVFTVQSVATTLLGSTTLTGATITTSQPVLDLAQTWNAGGVTFTGLKLNATDTASAAGSLLLDIGTGGGTYVSRFNIDKSGVAKAAAGTQLLPGFAFTAQASMGLFRSGSNALGFSSSGDWNMVLNSYGLQLASSGSVGFSSGNASSPPDTILTRRAAANLRFGAADAAAPVAQTLSVQSVVAGTTNTAGANLTITGSQGTGTGAGGSIIFQVALAGSSGTAQNALSTALTIASTGNITTTGSVTTQAPTGGTAAAWRLGTVATVTPTSPNRTIEVDIGGTIYYISAKTTNN